MKVQVMRLYAVYVNEYEDWDCVGVFDTYDKAYECIMEHWKDWYRCCEIISFELNNYYQLGIDSDGKTEAAWEIEWGGAEKELIPSDN